MGPWIPINEGTIQPESLVVFYTPNGNYIWGTGKDRDRIQKEYPDVTTYKVVTEAP